MSDVPVEILRELAAYSGDPWIPDNEYFVHAEAYMKPLWNQCIQPFLNGCDLTHTVDLAAGHGRNSVILSDLAQRLTIVDIQPGNIEVCKRRFSDRKNIEYVVNNGFDMQPVRDDDVNLVYCFDAMVHFDSDVVRSYLRDTRRVLVPGGRGFFHHSNYTGGEDWRTNVESRNFMSKEWFAHYARKEGLKVLSQQLVEWSGIADLDCFTLVERPS